MQRFTVAFEDVAADLLRLQAAERRMSVAALVRERALGGGTNAMTASQSGGPAVSPSPSSGVVSRVLDERGGSDGLVSPPRSSSPPLLDGVGPAGSTKCRMVVPRGVKCKSCGKVHG